MKLLSIPSSRTTAKLAAIICSAGLSASAADITMTGNNGSGTSGFNSGTNWPGNVAPEAGNDYFTGNYTLRTPNGSASAFTFAGDSLTVSGSGRLLYKGGNGGTIIINDFRLVNGGAFEQGGGSGDGIAMTLGGTITLGGTGGVIRTGAGNASGRTTTVTASIGGSGHLTLLNHEPGGGGLALTYLQGLNTYTGGTTIGSGNASNKFRLVVESSLGVGGDVEVLDGAELQLDINTALGTSQNLILSEALADGSINLNFDGTNAIGGLSFDGGLTFAGVGTYGGIGSGATFEMPVFTGAGTLTVVPEPAEISLAIAAGLGLLAFVRRARLRRS
jgi:hypothetical protein